MQEGQWNNAIKHLENALRLQRNVADYNLAMGECKLHLQHYKEALFYFGFVVKHKPKKVAGWEALIRCLYLAGYYEEAATHCLLALKATDEKPLFIFYQAASSFALNKSKEGLIYLETAMSKAPKQLKKLMDLAPSLLQNSKVIDIIARYKKGKKF
jgi:tetratricopeptide (TPR) repeat protein